MIRELDEQVRDLLLLHKHNLPVHCFLYLCVFIYYLLIAFLLNTAILLY